ncbi:Uncharacterized protein FKW44_015657 [Caligus rogercresseyi]|uniref:Uncharacterized protein n=1 Tax=Caligus rogercresseyi TaxID=217165 RepID=A0A7T8H0U3_CALRO|nr:Uncharacterized protein FKW44_015657 [Caligus rogercresseyi]
MKEKHLQRYQALINNLKNSGPRTCGPTKPRRQPLDNTFWPHMCVQGLQASLPEHRHPESRRQPGEVRHG